jgi:hypothetical protein
MECRAYSEKKCAAWIFSDLLNCIGRRGWFSAGPSADDGKSLLYVYFHTHHEDADHIFAFMQKAIHTYGGGTTWVLDRQQHNRFSLYPTQVELQAKKLGNLGEAVNEVRRELPGLERDAAADLLLLSDFIHKCAMENKY